MTGDAVKKTRAPAFAAACTRACADPPRHRNASAAAAAACALVAASLTIPIAPSLAAPSTKGVLSSNTELRRVVATDAVAILQHALPLPAEVRGEEVPPVRLLQTELEKLAMCTRSRTGAARQLNARASLLRIGQLLGDRRLDLLLDVPATKRADAAVALAKIDRSVSELTYALAVTETPPGSTLFPPKLAAFAGVLADSFDSDNKNDMFDGVLAERARKQAVAGVGKLEELMLDGSQFPYRIPRRYETLPRLLGRATVEMKITKQKGEWRNTDGSTAGREALLTVVLDGYSAPLTAGNFVDLAMSGAYDSTKVLSSQPGFCTRVGENEAKMVKKRSVPMEILVEGERTPVYGTTLDELGVGDLQPTLPVTAYGAVAMEHSVEDANDSSFNWLVFDIDPRSYTARALGGSVLTGSVATFGYVTENNHLVGQLREGDVIVSCKVTDGLQNFRPHA